MSETLTGTRIGLALCSVMPNTKRNNEGGAVNNDRPQWAPESINAHIPSAARVWDYFLGGSHNFVSDREVAKQAIAMKPDMPELAQEVRRFLREAVREMAEAGITQFLDIGSGIPTVGPVHEIARSVSPDAKVVYVDHDPVAVAHGKAILADDVNVAFVLGDLCSPREILDHPDVVGLLDFTQPIGVLLCAVLHFVPETANPAGIVATLRDAIVPGSMLAVQHATHDSQPRETVEMLEMWNANSPEPMFWRSRTEIGNLLTGFTLLEPGIVFLPSWHPQPTDQTDANPERFASYALLARRD